MSHATECDERRACHQAILSALIREAARRRTNDNWIDDERLAVVHAANRWSMAHGRSTVSVAAVEAIEHRAMGHVDYGSKLALYVTELVYDGQVHDA